MHSSNSMLAPQCAAAASILHALLALVAASILRRACCGKHTAHLSTRPTPPAALLLCGALQQPARCAVLCHDVMCRRQEVLVRFWLQSICRLISAVWEDAAQQALQPLLKVTLNVYDAVLQQR